MESLAEIPEDSLHTDRLVVEATFYHSDHMDHEERAEASHSHEEGNLDHHQEGSKVDHKDEEEQMAVGDLSSCNRHNPGQTAEVGDRQGNHGSLLEGMVFSKAVAGNHNHNVRHGVGEDTDQGHLGMEDNLEEAQEDSPLRVGYGL